MNTKDELDWMIVDGANGFEILWFLVCNEPFFWFLGAIGVGALALSWWCDNYLNTPPYKNDDNSWLREKVYE